MRIPSAYVTDIFITRDKGIRHKEQPSKEDTAENGRLQAKDTAT